MRAALIPLRSLHDGKQRLAAVLGAADRARLVQRLFVRTYTALQASGAIDHIAVVSPDPALLEWVRRWDVQPILQPDHGLNPGLEHGRRALLAEHPLTSLLVVLPDLPFVTLHEIQAFAAIDRARTVVLATDRAGAGTNALLVHPAAALPFCFGVDSYRRHRAAAVARGVQVRDLHAPRLAWDLDTPADLRDYQSGAVEQIGEAWAQETS